MDDLTKILAIWGAIVSTIALVWNIVKSSKEKGRIKIFVEKSFISRDDLEKEDPRLANALLSQNGSNHNLLLRTFIYLFNIGKRPITVIDLRVNLINEFEDYEELGYKYTSEIKSISFKQECPILLAAGAFYTFHVHEKFVDKNFNGIEVHTSDGRKYKQGRKEINSLKKVAEFNKLPEKMKLEYFLKKTKHKKKFRLSNMIKKS